MSDLYTTLSITSLVLTTGGLLGGFYAFRTGLVRTANEVQERVIHALESEITSLHDRIDEMKDESIRLRLVINTICVALKGRGLTISIENDIVSIHDTHTDDTITAHVQQREG